VAFNRTSERQLGWASLRDQIEVNIIGCPRGDARLPTPDFAQAVALFQRNQGDLTADGKLGATTWTRMKTIRAERDPFPRVGVSLDFDDTASEDHSDGFVHPAIDIALDGGTPVPVVADGLVLYAGISGKILNCDTVDTCRSDAWTADPCMFLHYGRVVIVEHSNRGPGVQPGGDSVYTIYGHVQFSGSRRVSAGEPVKAGRIIGEVGTGCVGNSTGPHLHYAVVSGPRGFRFRGGRPVRCELFSRGFCALPNAQCAQCPITHFWRNVVTPQRPRTTGAGAAFRW
jgi:murein DD-endopeptidase MepM/ murein hydrolase activator NlpD